MEGDCFNSAFREVKAAVNEGRGDVGAKRGFVPREVVGMGVRNERTRLGIPWVKPEVELRQVEATLEANGDHGWDGKAPGWWLRAKKKARLLSRPRLGEWVGFVN